MTPSDQKQRHVDIKEHAAVVFALAVARGALYGVRNGDLRTDELLAIIGGTSSINIANTIGVPEERLFVDWEQHLTHEEREAIRSGQPGSS